ncbi:periplasmic heavy metal sensor [Sandarakinorhabdus oryzae]|uniref:periplasmic heavy metal sensor n=1 Tax=Sandarakinorhabdus oryzae TaxID=2675220 RepID=UPI0012E179AE|nr:periplasmic heavy metal sensor [Sandarakinorhabdus oryzae]
MNAKLLLLAALIAAPAVAQPAPPPPPPAPMGGPHGPGMAMGARMFPSMSEAGRQIMQDAMMAGGGHRDERARIEAARDKMLAALESDRFDAAAVKRAMDEERSIADASRQQRQAAMLTALQKLSPEDRKAFVADSRAMKARMQSRMDGWRGKWRERMDLRRGQPAPTSPPQSEL